MTHYQEQPQLLDPVLESLVRPLATLLLDIAQPLDTFSKDPNAQARLSAVSCLLWQLASVRGYKTVLKFFPNEVSAVEPSVALLDFLSSTEGASLATGGGGSIDQQDGIDSTKSNWEAQYVMLMWLSLLAMIPFDLAIIDSSLSSTVTEPAVHNPTQNEKPSENGSTPAII